MAFWATPISTFRTILLLQGMYNFNSRRSVQVVPHLSIDMASQFVQTKDAIKFIISIVKIVLKNSQAYWVDKTACDQLDPG